MNHPKPNLPDPEEALIRRWQEQKKLYETCANGAIEKKMVSAIFNSPLVSFADRRKEAPEAHLKVWESLMEVLSLWNSYGNTYSNSVVTSQQLIEQGEFMKRYYPTHTLAELEWAIELYVYRHLPMTYSNSVTIMPATIATIMRAYQDFKGTHKMRLDREVAFRSMDKSGTPEENADGMRFMISRVYEQLQQNAHVVVLLQDVYNYLRRTEQLGNYADQDDYAKEYAARKYVGMQKTGDKDFVDAVPLKELLRSPNFTKSTQENMHQIFIIEYVVREHFKKNTLDQVLARVRPQHWKI